MPRRLRPAGASTGEARRWGLPAAVFLVVFGLSFALAAWAVVRERRDDAVALASEGRAAGIAIEASVNEAFQRSQAVTALFHASDEVTADEFASFIGDVGFTPGMFGIGFIAVVDHDALAAFEARLTADHPGSFVFQLDGLKLIPTESRPHHHPIQFFESPGGLPAWGFDVASDPVFAAMLHESIGRIEPAASSFLSFPGRPGADGIVLFQPLTDADGAVVGVAAAMLDLSDVLAAVSPERTHGGASAVVIDAAGVTERPSSDWVGMIPVADRTWLVLLDHTGDSPYLAGAGIVMAGLLAAAALAFALSVMGERIRQRREIEELRVLDRQKDDFLATVSHELRTPLTSVVGFADELVAAHADLPEADRAEMMRIIADEAHAMEGIVQDLLAASRLQQGSGIPVAVTRVPDLTGEISALAVGRHAARVTTTDPGDTAVIADPARLQQIMRNLLENAVRHGRPPVEVTVSRRGATIDLVIRDAGRGIAEEVWSTLFDRYRWARRDAGQPASTGIGLWLSRELARIMGGDLTLRPSAGGAVFVLTLPAADPAIGAAAGF